MKVVLVEPWLGGSHREWAEGYASASDHQIEVIGLPAASWRWRLQGGALPLAAKISRWVTDNGVPDALLVSGLVDVAHLLALTRRRLGADVPIAVYQHESQLVYPATAADRAAALVNWVSWCVADVVLFNSDFHRRAVVQALPVFLRAQPDQSHLTELDAVTERFEVLPLGLDLSWIGEETLVLPRSTNPDRRPLIVWPHRWEDDKDPDAFIRALRRLDGAGLDYGLVLAGVEPQVGRSRRTAIAESQAAHVVACGPFHRTTYRAHLMDADIVVSCATHDFFGAGVAEAVAAGCRPVVPAALAYPEVLGPDFVGYRPGHFGSALEEAVRCWPSVVDGDLAADVARHDWRILAPIYDARLTRLVSGGAH
ncbi:MAG: glycosyltransferase involved in cell wall biosynthesis [Acidimicrobiales bacterium]